jgi:hypothetical protein
MCPINLIKGAKQMKAVVMHEYGGPDRREAGRIVTVIIITFTLDIIILGGRIDLTDRPRGAFPGPRLLAT